MSNVHPPTAPKAKPADLPDTGLEDDASSDEGVEQALKTFDDDSTGTNPAALLDDGAFEDTSTTVDQTNTQDMYERNLALYNESIISRPLVNEVVPISDLRDEYKNPKFIKQIDWLEEHGFHSIRRIRGDGDCFYRSFGFAFIERIIHATNKREAVRRAIKVIDTTLPMFYAMSFDEVVFEDSLRFFRKLIVCIVEGVDWGRITEELLLQIFQNPYESNTIVSYLRLATAAQIQLAPEDYAPFLTNQDIPDSEEILESQDFNARFVIPLGKEADDVQISALCRVLQMNVDIAYVDGREDNSDDKVRFVPFRSDADKDAAPISLLYRPGHYDILVGKYHE